MTIAWLAARRSAWMTGALLGMGGGAAPQALLLRPDPTRDGGRLRSWLAVAIGFFVMSLPLALPFFGEFLRWAFGAPTLQPGVGLSNLLYYRPVEPAASMAVWRWAAPLALVILAVGLDRSRRTRSQPLAAAGALWTVAIFLLPSVPPHAVAVPIGLLTLGALVD